MEYRLFIYNFDKYKIITFSTTIYKLFPFSRQVRLLFFFVVFFFPPWAGKQGALSGILTATLHSMRFHFCTEHRWIFYAAPVLVEACRLVSTHASRGNTYCMYCIFLCTCTDYGYVCLFVCVFSVDSCSLLPCLPFLLIIFTKGEVRTEG